MARNPRINTTFSAADRYHVLNQAQGITTETFDHRVGVTTTQPTGTGQLRLTAMPVLEGDHIDSLAMYCQTAGVGMSLVRYAIYDSKGTLLGSTPDLSGSMASLSWLVGNLSTPVDFTYTGMAYAAVINMYATTAPFYVCAGIPSAAWLSLPTGFRFAYLLPGQTDIVASVPLTQANAGSQNYYVMAW